MIGIATPQLPAATSPGATDRAAGRPISPVLLGKAALRIGARMADDDLGLALAALGLVLASLRRVPHRVALAGLAALMPPEQRSHAEAILATAHAIVEGWAAQEDAALAAALVAGSA